MNGPNHQTSPIRNKRWNGTSKMVFNFRIVLCYFPSSVPTNQTSQTSYELVWGSINQVLVSSSTWPRAPVQQQNTGTAVRAWMKSEEKRHKESETTLPPLGVVGYDTYSSMNVPGTNTRMYEYTGSGQVQYKNATAHIRIRTTGSKTFYVFCLCFLHVPMHVPAVQGFRWGEVMRASILQTSVIWWHPFVLLPVVRTSYYYSSEASF